MKSRNDLKGLVLADVKSYIKLIKNVVLAHIKNR